MKQIKGMPEDVCIGDLIRVILKNGSSVVGYVRQNESPQVQLSSYDPSYKQPLPDEAFTFLDVMKGRIDGSTAVGYEVLRRENPKPRYDSAPRRLHDMQREGPFAMPRPFSDSYSQELQEESDARQAAVDREQRKDHENFLEGGRGEY